MPRHLWYSQFHVIAYDPRAAFFRPRQPLCDCEPGCFGAGRQVSCGGRPSSLSAVARFDALYLANPSYYGKTVPRDFAGFLAGRSLSAHHCLDLGAGQGRHALHLARAGAKVRAVDSSPVAMAQLSALAEAEGLEIITELADVCTYVLPVERYDLIVCSTILDHLETPCRNRLGVEIAAALKPGGVVYCEVFTIEDPGYLSQTGSGVSETARPVRHYFRTGELRNLFPAVTVLEYWEGLKQDRAHGPWHWHGLALIVGIKV